MRYKTSTLCEIAILVAMISILGSIKIPNIIFLALNSNYQLH